MTAKELIQNIKDGTADQRWTAVENAKSAGPDAISDLGALIDSGTPEIAKAASEALRNIALFTIRKGASSERKIAAAQLLTLTNPSHDIQLRRDALNLLGFVGGKGEVGKIAPLLNDKILGEDARMALQRIPGRESERALQETEGAQKGDAQVSLKARSTSFGKVGIRK